VQNIIYLAIRKTITMEFIILNKERRFFFKAIKNATKNGQFFTAVFTKKDGTDRKISGRRGVGMYAKGVGLSYNPDEKNNLIVAESSLLRKNNRRKIVGLPPVRPYRTIKVDNLKSITIKGRTYKFE
tara:strand:- start:1844 stop:2224 length:381 start_codon:yes stop_codon:yes gene_type:complete